MERGRSLGGAHGVRLSSGIELGRWLRLALLARLPDAHLNGCSEILLSPTRDIAVRRNGREAMYKYISRVEVGGSKKENTAGCKETLAS